MPKYFTYKIANCFLYFTAHCVGEPMHVHASLNSDLNENGSAKFFVKENGDAIYTKMGGLDVRKIKIIQKFIKNNINSMYKRWRLYSNQGFYKGRVNLCLDALAESLRWISAGFKQKKQSPESRLRLVFV